MFKVLYRPFPESLGADSRAHAVLVWSSHKGQRILVQGISQEEEKKEMQREWYETTAAALNTSVSFEFTSAMLRSIEAAWQQGEYQERRMREASRPSCRFFGADFGRMDFGRPGRGGHGFDDGDGY